jgi:hypothetical protein
MTLQEVTQYRCDRICGLRELRGSFGLFRSLQCVPHCIHCCHIRLTLCSTASLKADNNSCTTYNIFTEHIHIPLHFTPLPSLACTINCSSWPSELIVLNVTRIPAPHHLPRMQFCHSPLLWKGGVLQSG